jgi:3-methyladenine DNA glycosylase/8-oxoguanine DNA glycosylase
MPEYFEYGEKEIQWLRSRDQKLGAAMDRIGHIDRQVTPDLFSALVNVIVGQQISSKAQATIWGRMQERLGEITPESIGSISVEELQTCGISMRKASYIKEATNSVLDGSLDLEILRMLPDEEVCDRLSQIKGIGVWTAEMLMTFSMQRPDVMSFGDLAILRGLRMLHNHRTITPKLFEKYKRKYSPYATVASLYLWAIAGGACPDLVDHAPKTEAQKKKDAKKRLK